MGRVQGSGARRRDDGPTCVTARLQRVSENGSREWRPSQHVAEVARLWGSNETPKFWRIRLRRIPGLRRPSSGEFGCDEFPDTLCSQAVRVSSWFRLWLLLALFLPILTGCGETELQDDYGKRNGPTVFASVNGTAVFAKMCEARGHSVFSWPVLSPRIQERADCIVWFPDDYSPPSREVQRWLERWLKAKPKRTLIYVGRHYDAVAWYWESVQGSPLPAEELSEIGRRRKKARRDFGETLKPLSKSTDHDWFVLDGRHQHRKITSLEGDADWLAGIDPTKVSMELNTRLVPSDEADVLLASEGDAIVFRQSIRQSQLIAVANGSFLLNAPLSNREHRRLAGKLIDEIGPPEKTIAFIEFAPFGDEIAATDPTFGPRLGFEVFQAWPTNWILLHLCFLGVLFCFWRFPIFGRPRDPESDSTSDFGLHIEAVARLLARTDDTAYAHTRLQHYRQTTRIDAAPVKTPINDHTTSESAPPNPGGQDPDAAVEGSDSEPLFE